MAAVLGATALMAVGVMFAPPAEAHDHPVLPEGDWTEEQVAEAEAKVHEVEQVLPEKFGDVSVLEDLGYYNFGVPTPNGYWHYINPALFDDEHILDPNYPESLVYKSGPNGTRILEAAMFFLPTGTTMETIPEDLQWWPGWHQHAELCTGADGRFSGLTRPDGTCAVGTPGVGPPMMHIWIVDTECGHRFTGLGVGGNICDVEGEHPHPPGEEPHPHPTTPGPTTGPTYPEEPPGTTPEPTTPGTTPPTDGSPTPTTPPSNSPVAPPATPVPGQPDYTG